MSAQQRLSLVLSFGMILLIADTLCAQGPPPLPAPPRPESRQLDSLRDRFFNTSATPSQPIPQPIPQPAQTAAQQGVHFPEHLSAPNHINQTSFATNTTPAMTEGLPYDDLSDNPRDSEYADEEYVSIHHPALERSLSKRHEEFEGEDSAPKPEGWRNKLAMPNFTPLVSVVSTLLIVIAAFFVLAIFLRKVSPQSSRALPKEAFECLGRYYLTQKHQVQLLRVGSRIVLVSVMPDGVTTLAEITDPDEAVSLLGLCRRLDTNSATEMFRKTVASISEEELSRPPQRPVVASRRGGQAAAALDLYSEPDESLAAILARGRQYGR